MAEEKRVIGDICYWSKKGADYMHRVSIVVQIYSTSGY